MIITSLWDHWDIHTLLYCGRTKVWLFFSAWVNELEAVRGHSVVGLMSDMLWLSGTSPSRSCVFLYWKKRHYVWNLSCFRVVCIMTYIQRCMCRVNAGAEFSAFGIFQNPSWRKQIDVSEMQTSWDPPVLCYVYACLQQSPTGPSEGSTQHIATSV